MNLCVRLKNGHEVTAKTEEWLAAIITSLPPEHLEAVAMRVEQRLVAYSTPGNYVLHAEPGAFWAVRGNGRDK